MEKYIFHIDANSAYLSWEAVERLKNGSKLDLRTVPSIVGGDPEKRRGIVLARSYIAKEFGVKTAETLYQALQKCPNLIIVPPRYDVYTKYSNQLIDLLNNYTNLIERYSIDEVFVNVEGALTKHTDPIALADEIRLRIKKELGFTVSIGVSTNKLLAKMATDLRKPNFTNTLFQDELEKMWVLPVNKLFMCGTRTTPKLNKIGIETIGDLAHSDKNIIKNILKSHGELIWNYANGIDFSEVHIERPMAKGLGNSTTISHDVNDRIEANMILLGLCEFVSKRLRDNKYYCQVIGVHIKFSDFISKSTQKKLYIQTNSTNIIYNEALKLLDNIWTGNSIRQIGIRTSDITTDSRYQYNMFDTRDYKKEKDLDNAIDKMRNKYGNKSISRACFINSIYKPMIGGVGEEGDFMMMNSQL